MLALVTAFVPETYPPVCLARKARKVREETGNSQWYAPIEKMDRSILHTIKISIYRPFLLLTLAPMCTNLCLFSALLLGIIYLFFSAFDLVFENNHHFKLWQVGLTFLGILIGMALGVASDPFWHAIRDKLMKKREEETGEVGGSEPEYRLPPTVLGAVLVPIGLFWFAFTT